MNVFLRLSLINALNENDLNLKLYLSLRVLTLTHVCRLCQSTNTETREAVEIELSSELMVMCSRPAMCPLEGSTIHKVTDTFLMFHENVSSCR